MGFRSRCEWTGEKSNGTYWEYEDPCYLGGLLAGAVKGAPDDEKQDGVGTLESNKITSTTINEWHDFPQELTTREGGYRAKLQFLWSPIAKSITKPTGSNMLCATQPLKLKGILSVKDSTLTSNVIWEQNLNDELTSIQPKSVCFCSNPNFCTVGDFYTASSPSSCSYGYTHISSFVDPNEKKDTIWTVIPNQNGSILNTTVPSFDGY